MLAERRVYGVFAGFGGRRADRVENRFRTVQGVVWRRYDIGPVRFDVGEV